MNQKYHEFAGKFLPVVAVSGLLALFTRLKIMDWKPDGFFFNIMFVLMLVLFITMYSHIVLLGEELIKFMTRLFRKNNMESSQIEEDEEQFLEENKKNSEDVQTLEIDIQPSSNDDQIFNEVVPILKDEKHKLTEDKSTREIVSQISDTSLEIENPKDLSDLDKIRIRARAREEELIQEKLDLIVQYTKENLALYITDEDLYKLCDYLVVFLRDGKIENVNPIKITVLATTDLMHFGWNVWNHYRGNNQRINVAKFLKTVFSQSFTEIDEIITIEKLLTSRKEQGIIKIEKNLLQ